MTNDDERGEITYWAFISYRHADNSDPDHKWATWLHQQLEVYDVPADLVGSENSRGELIPDQIYPVFRDEDSLPADADLEKVIFDALDRSRFLIVLCSPRAVQSTHLNDEIIHFKRSGKTDRIMAAILLGEPNASVDERKAEDPEDARTLECFPPALRHDLNSNGDLDIASRTEPIAANFRLRDGGKGLTSPEAYYRKLVNAGRSRADARRMATKYESQLNNAKLKIIAGILGVPLERLTKRDKLHQLALATAKARQSQKIAIGVAVMAFLAFLGAGIATQQWRLAEHAKSAAEQSRSETLVHQSRFLADASIQATDQSETELAVLLALNALPGSRGGERPVVQAAIDALNYARFFRQEPLELRVGTDVQSCSLNYDGSTALTIGRGSTHATLWDTSSGLRRSRLTHPAAVTAAVFSLDGHVVATTDEDGNVSIWTTETGLTLAKLNNANVATQDAGGVLSMQFSPDSTRLVTTGGAGATIWDTASGTELESFAHPAPINHASFDRSGERLLTGSSDGTITWRDTRQLAELDTVSHAEPVLWVGFDSYGDHIAARLFGDTAVIWRLSSPPVDRPLLQLDKVSDLSFHPGSHDAIVGFSTGELSIVGTADAQARTLASFETASVIGFAVTGAVTRTMEPAPVGVSLDVAGRKALVFAKGTTSVFRVSTGARLAELTMESNREAIVGTAAANAAISGDGSRVMAGFDGGVVRIWRLDDLGPEHIESPTVLGGGRTCLTPEERRRYFLRELTPDEWGAIGCPEFAENATGETSTRL